MTLKKSPSPARQRAERAGRIAEWASCALAMLSGWRILARRQKTPFGEIDLVCKRGKCLLCIEVKYRHTVSDLSLMLPSPQQQDRLARAASYIFARQQEKTTHPIDLKLRFDIHIWIGYFWIGYRRLIRYTDVALGSESWHFNKNKM